MILADLHVHTTMSDGRMDLPDVVDYFGARGVGAIAITDHVCEESSLIGRAAHWLDKCVTRDTYPAYLESVDEQAERAWSRYGMVVIPGFELSKNSLSNHRSAHILAIGVREYLPADGDPVELARNVHEKGGIAVAAHPVHTRRLEKQTYHLWDRREELADELDAWEVASGPHLFGEVLTSRLPMLANSDFHRPAHMSSWKTVVDAERRPDAILAAIRAQRVRFRFFHDRSAAPAVLSVDRPRIPIPVGGAAAG